jgi:hypothetical protein
MPCNTIQTATVEIGKMNQDLAVDALNRLHLAPKVLASGLIAFGSGTLNLQTGQLSLRDGRTIEEFAATLKREYSTSIVMSQAKKFGWQMKEVAPKKWEVIRR